MQIETARPINDSPNVIDKNKEEYDKAIANHTQTLFLNLRDAKTFFNRGNVFVKIGEYDRAISDFDQAVRINPNDVKARHNRAIAYLRKGEYDKAWEDVRRVKSLGSDIDPAFLEQLRRSSGRQQ